MGNLQITINSGGIIHELLLHISFLPNLYAWIYIVKILFYHNVLQFVRNCFRNTDLKYRVVAIMMSRLKYSLALSILAELTAGASSVAVQPMPTCPDRHITDPADYQLRERMSPSAGKKITHMGCCTAPAISDMP